MKLYWSSRSPFVRKVMVVAHEAGVADQIERERVVVAPAAPDAVVMQFNPLNKIPTLVLADGAVLYDSAVICEYLDGLHPGSALFPADRADRLIGLRRQALGDGLMEVSLLRLGEERRPPEGRSPVHLAAYRLKVERALDVLEAEAPALLDGPFTIGHVAIGCALSYLDFRFPADAWRDGRPALAAWHQAFSARPSVRASVHADAY
jgi:glutathione S-transferase